MHFFLKKSSKQDQRIKKSLFSYDGNVLLVYCSSTKQSLTVQKRNLKILEMSDFKETKIEEYIFVSTYYWKGHSLLS